MLTPDADAVGLESIISDDATAPHATQAKLEEKLGAVSMAADLEEAGKPVASTVKAVTLSWHGLQFKVRDRKSGKEKVILHPSSGVVAPGQVLAVMGPSGSGKTSLCDILAGRITASKTEGEVLLNGVNLSQRKKKQVMSYVAQEDTLMGQFTVHETLVLAARFVYGYSCERAWFEARVQEAVDRMGLTSCRDTLVGDIFRKGISGGQKRRLSIAVELISRPSILVLDEPTSGLDSASAYAVVRLLRDLAAGTGMTLVTTIHQPSSEVWAMFDRFLMLSLGRTMYFGTAAGAVPYFAGLGYVCPQFSNPADFLVSLVNSDFVDLEQKADPEELARQYLASELCRVALADAEGARLHDHSDAAEAETDAHVKKWAFCADLWTLSRRNLLNNARNPGIFWVRFAMYFMLALLIGIMYIGLGDDFTASGINSRVGLLFYVAAFLVFMSVAVLPFYIMERATFVREHLNGWYGTLPYVLSNFACAQPGLVLISIVSTVCVVSISGLNGFGIYFLCLWLSLVMAESFMNLVASLAPHYIVGIALAAGAFGFFMLCEGFLIVRNDIPDYLIWGYYIAPHTYSFRTFMYNEFATIPVFTTSGGNQSGMDVLAFYDMEDVVPSQDLATLVGFAAFFQLCFWAVLHFKWGRPSR